MRPGRALQGQQPQHGSERHGQEHLTAPLLLSRRPGNMSLHDTGRCHRRGARAATFGGTDVAMWARISLSGHGPQRQVSRVANPMLRALFFPQPGADTEALNAGAPASDVATFGEAVRRTAAQVAKLSRATNPMEHASTVVAAFLPDLRSDHAVAAGRRPTRRKHLAQSGGARIPALGSGRARGHPGACGPARAARARPPAADRLIWRTPGRLR
jgi:hypothetical protein